MPTQTTQKNNGEKTRKAEWKKVKLGEVYQFQYGKGNKNPSNGGVYPVYGAGGIIGYFDEYNAEDSPIIGHMGANCGTVIFGKGKHFVTYNGIMALIKQGYDLSFGYYLLLSNDFKKFVRGSAQPFISYDLLNDVEVEIPPLSEQKKIAEVLLAYDDLIEVNQKKIKTLETLAQTLYKEWFVKPTKDGLPDGWEMKSIRDVYEIKYGKTLPKTEITNNDKYSVYGAGGVIGFYKQKNVDKRTTLITSRGNGSGTVWRTYGEGFITNNSFTVNPLEDYKYLEFPFIFYSLLNADINSSVTGSAQPQITIENINYVQIVIPEKNKIIDFQNIVNIYYDQIDNLIFQNQNLQKTRDILIPQLVGGRVEVK